MVDGAQKLSDASNTVSKSCDDYIHSFGRNTSIRRQTDRQTDERKYYKYRVLCALHDDVREYYYAYKAIGYLILGLRQKLKNSIFRHSIYLLLLLYIALSLSEGVCSSFDERFTYLLTYLFETVYSCGYTFSTDHCCGFRRCVW